MVSSAEAAAGSLRFPRGRVEWMRPYFGWFRLICIVTSLLCGAMLLYWHLDFDSESRNEPGVTVTASGFLSITPEILEDGDTLKVVSHSSGPVDVVVTAEDGRDLSTYFGLLPGETFGFECGGPCTVVASAS